MNMDFGANKIPIEVIKGRGFGGTYFRYLFWYYWYRKSWKEFDELKNVDKKYYCLNYYDVTVNKYGVKCGKPLRFWENKR